MRESSLYGKKMGLSSVMPADWGVKSKRIAGSMQPTVPYRTRESLWMEQEPWQLRPLEFF
jgi:hypothetical protein